MTPPNKLKTKIKSQWDGFHTTKEFRDEGAILSKQMLEYAYASMMGYHYVDNKIFKTDEELEEYQRTKDFDKYINDLLEE